MSVSPLRCSVMPLTPWRKRTPATSRRFSCHVSFASLPRLLDVCSMDYMGLVDGNIIFNELLFNDKELIGPKSFCLELRKESCI